MIRRLLPALLVMLCAPPAFAVQFEGPWIYTSDMDSIVSDRVYTSQPFGSADFQNVDDDAFSASMIPALQEIALPEVKLPVTVHTKVPHCVKHPVACRRYQKVKEFCKETLPIVSWTAAAVQAVVTLVFFL